MNRREIERVDFREDNLWSHISTHNWVIYEIRSNVEVRLSRDWQGTTSARGMVSMLGKASMHNVVGACNMGPIK